MGPEYPPSFMSLFLISATPSEEGKVAGRILPLRREREAQRSLAALLCHTATEEPSGVFLGMFQAFFLLLHLHLMIP